MGKYFSKDSDLTKFNIAEEKSKQAIPTSDNLTTPISETTREKLATIRRDSPQTQDDYIDMVRVQADAASDMVNKYSNDAKKMMEQQFEKFAPAELFEKLNQIIFTLADLSNRITSLEHRVTTGVPTPEKKPIEITDPEQLYKLQNRLDELTKVRSPESIPDTRSNDTASSEDKPDITEIKKRLLEAKSGKTRKIPSEGLADEAIKLEEVFPNLDDEAYQAAYTAMNKYNKVEHSEESKPEPGSLRNLSGF